MGWYVGEPSDWAPNGHSYYDSPKGWEEKIARIEKILVNYDGKYKLGSRSSWSCYIDEVRPAGENWPHVYKFDFWEDEKSFEDQMIEFVEKIG